MGVGSPLKINAANKIWIRFPDLPTLFWQPRIHKSFASIMGTNFVEANAFTKERSCLNFARSLTEVPLGLIPVLEVKLVLEEQKVKVQTIEYESRIRFCSECRSTSHFRFVCMARKVLSL